MHFTYILKSLKDYKLYIGYTNNLKNRINKHKEGKVISTKWRRPLKLIYYETYLSEEDAKRREKFLKTGWGRNYIKKYLKNTLKK